MLFFNVDLYMFDKINLLLLYQGKGRDDNGNQMERRVPTRPGKYWAESRRGDGQGDVERKDHQSYRRPYMMGKARGKEEVA